MLLALWLSTCGALDGGAQPTATVAGQVRARGTRRPIAVAHVSSDDGAEGETGPEGDFQLEVQPGARKLRVQASGFRAQTYDEVLDAGERVEVRYTLAPDQLNPFETVVRSERDRTEVSRVALGGSELRDVPGTLGDPFRAITLMPGVTSTVSGIAYPVVRGAAPASTGFFLDGVRVPQLFHVFIGPAIVHPDFIESIDFLAGGAPVKYGRLLGGVVDAKISRPREAGLHAEASIDLFNAGALVEYPFQSTGTSVTLAGRFSYSGLLVKPISRALDPARAVTVDFADYQARIEQQLGGGKLRLFAFGAWDEFGQERFYAQTSTFHRADLRYRRELGPGELEAGFTFGADNQGFLSQLFTLQADGVARDEQLNIAQLVIGARLRWSAELSSSWRVSFGATFDQTRASTSQTLTDKRFTPPLAITLSQPGSIGTFWAAWAEAQWTPTRQLSVTGGVRADEYHLVPRINQVSADPRLSISWAENERVSLRAAAGLYHQPPTFLVPLSVLDVASVRYGLQEVWQFSGGFNWKLWEDLELSLDAYFNPMPKLLEVGTRNDDMLDVLDIDALQKMRQMRVTERPGVSYGLDLLLRWPMKRRVFGWLALSVQRSQRLTPSGEQPWAFDQTLVANAVVSYRFDNGLSLGLTLHFNTGRPESGEFGSRTNVLIDGRWKPVSRSEVDRLPAFFRLDVRASKTWLTDLFALELYLDVLNVTVRQEVLGFQYGYDGAGAPVRTAESVPVIVPSLGFKGRY